MKTLLILRHAKTERDHPAGDHARRLTTRGMAAATAVGHTLHQQIGLPDRIVTSDARRTVQTAALVAAACAAADRLHLDPSLYLADQDDLLAAIRRLPDSAATVVLVGHNPGLEALVPALSGGADRHLPPAGLAHLTLPVDHWAAVAPGTGTLVAFVVPGD